MGQLEIWLEGGRHRWVVNRRRRDGACRHLGEKKGRNCRPATWGRSKERSSREGEDVERIERTRLVIILRLVHCRLFGTTVPIVVVLIRNNRPSITCTFPSTKRSRPPALFIVPRVVSMYGLETRSGQGTAVARESACCYFKVFCRIPYRCIEK